MTRKIAKVIFQTIVSFTALVALLPNLVNGTEVFAVALNTEKPEEAGILIKGPITHGTYDQFIHMHRSLSEIGKVVDRVYLSSMGGLVEEAIKLSREVRRLNLRTIAPFLIDEDIGGRARFVCPNFSRISEYVLYEVRGEFIFSDSEPDCICASACALIWLGGIWRDGVGSVHRSFIIGEEFDNYFDKFRSILEASHFEIRSLISELNLPHWVGDAIISTNSGAVTNLNASNADLNLEFDPPFQEYLIKHCGHLLNRNDLDSKYELLSRPSLSKKEEEILHSLISYESRIRHCYRNVHLEMLSRG